MAKNFSESSTKNDSVSFKTNFAYEIKLKTALAAKGISEQSLHAYLREGFMHDMRAQQSIKVGHFFLKLAQLREELARPEGQRFVEQEITANKKFKLPWTLEEVSGALRNVLRKFD